MDAMPELVFVLDRLGEGRTAPRAIHRLAVIAALHVADLGDDDDLVAGDFAGIDQLAQHAPHQALARAIHVIG